MRPCSGERRKLGCLYLSKGWPIPNISQCLSKSGLPAAARADIHSALGGCSDVSAYTVPSYLMRQLVSTCKVLGSRPQPRMGNVWSRLLSLHKGGSLDSRPSKQSRVQCEPLSSRSLSLLLLLAQQMLHVKANLFSQYSKIAMLS